MVFDGKEFFNLSFRCLWRKRVRRSRGILFLVCPGLLAYLGQFGSTILRIFDWKDCICSLLFLFWKLSCQSIKLAACNILSKFALFRLKEARVVGVWEGGLFGLEFRRRLYDAVHVMMV